MTVALHEVECCVVVGRQQECSCNYRWQPELVLSTGVGRVSRYSPGKDRMVLQCAGTLVIMRHEYSLGELLTSAAFMHHEDPIELIYSRYIELRHRVDTLPKDWYDSPTEHQ